MAESTMFPLGEVEGTEFPNLNLLSLLPAIKDVSLFPAINQDEDDNNLNRLNNIDDYEPIHRSSPLDLQLTSGLSSSTSGTSNTRQHPPLENQNDLEIALLAFQEEEMKRYGDSVLSYIGIIEFSPDDFDLDMDLDLDSDNESGDLLPQFPAESKARALLESKFPEQLDKVELDPYTGNPAELYPIEDEFTEELSTQIKNENHPENPAELYPIEDKFTEELGENFITADPTPHLFDGFINTLKAAMKAMACIQTINVEGVDAEDSKAIVVVGFFNAVTNNIELYFQNGEDMARVVGVGLQHALVAVKPGIIVEVQEMEQQKWEELWYEIKSGSNRFFRILKVTFPITTEGDMECKHEALKCFSTSPSSTHHEESGDLSSIRSGEIFQPSLLWELLQFLIMDIVVHTLLNRFGNDFEVYYMNHYPSDNGNDTPMGWGRSLFIIFSNIVSRRSSGNNFDGVNHEGQSGGTSDGGGAGGEGGGGGDGGGGDGGGGGGGDDHVNISINDKTKCSRVKVIFKSGGDTQEPFSGILGNKSRERLKNVQITPVLIFDFSKGTNFKEIKVTTSVIFGLDPEICDDFDDFDAEDFDSNNLGSDHHFGWFHDHIRASLGPSDENILHTIHLEHNFKEEDVVAAKTINKVTTSTETTKSKGKGIQGQARFGTHGFEIRGGGNINWRRSQMDNQGNEHSVENGFNQTSLGNSSIRVHPLMHKALLECRCRGQPFPLVAADILSASYRESLRENALCLTQRVAYSGTWVPNENADEMTEYIFKASRRLREIVVRKSQHIKKKGKSDKLVSTKVEEPLKQVMEKRLLINYGMTDLVDGSEPFPLAEGRQVHDPQNLVRFNL